MPCASNQDCPSSAICCDGADPSCDGTRLPSGDNANPGEFVVSADGLTVSDTITGLVWQRDGSGTRAGCSGLGSLSCTWDEADAYCSSLVLGGLSGWRLPAWMELLTILDLTRDSASATVDPTAFPNTGTSSYWTSSLYGSSSFETLYISFADGTSEDCSGVHDNVRCVRGSRCYPKARFSALDGGTVRDTLTGLVWQQQVSTTKMTWSSAQSYCSSLGSGFRLPTLKELDSLMNPTAPSGPSLDKTAFPSASAGQLWTSSPYLGSSAAESARYGDFPSADPYLCDNGGQNWTQVGELLRVRCVR
jgi:hypothetical protein